jgi:hypothetical protein
MHWGHSHFHRDQGMTLALMGKNLKFCEFKYFNKVYLKKVSEPQNIDHTTQSDLHTFWLVLAMVFGEMNFVICCPTFSKMLSFNAGATRVDFNIHPHGNPRHSWKKIGTLLLLFEAQ